MLVLNQETTVLRWYFADFTPASDNPPQLGAWGGSAIRYRLLYDFPYNSKSLRTKQNQQFIRIKLVLLSHHVTRQRPESEMKVAPTHLMPVDGHGRRRRRGRGVRGVGGGRARRGRRVLRVGRVRRRRRVRVQRGRRRRREGRARAAAARAQQRHRRARVRPRRLRHHHDITRRTGRSSAHTEFNFKQNRSIT